MRAPVRLDRLRLGLQQSLSPVLAGTGALLQWGRGEPQQEQLPASWASLQMLSGPTPWGWTRARAHEIAKPSLATYTVGPVAEDDVIIAIVNGVRIRHDVAFGETTEQARDALAVATANEPGIIVNTSGTDKITIAPLAEGDLWDARAAGVCTVEIADDGSLLEFTSGLYAMRIEVQTFGKDPVMGAHNLAMLLQHALVTPAVSQQIYEYGFSLLDRNLPILDLSAIAGGYWESRAAFTFGLLSVGATARGIGTIEHAVVGLRVQVADVLVTLPQFTVNAP